MSFDISKFASTVPPFVQQYIIDNLETWIKETVIDSVRAFAIAAGVSQHYLDSIKLVRTGPYTARVELNYFGPNMEPLGIWFEHGTKPHIIRAVIAMALHWIDQKTGKDRFAKWVKHKGTKAKHIMELGARHGMPRLREKIITETNKLVQSKVVK